MSSPAQRALFACLVLALAAVVALVAVGNDAATAPQVEPARPGTPTTVPIAQASSRIEDVARRELAQRAGAGPALPAAPLVARVVDASDAPLPGAEVGVHVERSHDDYVPAELREQRAWAGDVVTADERGEVRIATPEALSWTLYGRRGELWGVQFVPFAAAAEVQVLRLRRDLTVRAQVLDPADRPVVGARVALGDEADIAGFAMRTFATTVEPNGIATFGHAQQRVRAEWGDDGVVMVGTPLGDPVWARVDLAAPAREPYVLRLPGTGSVHVTLVDRDADQAADRGARPIEGLTETVYATLFERLAAGERGYWLPFGGPRLDVAHVGIGLHFRLELSSPEVSGMVEFAGPTAPGERVEVALAVARQPTMSGRLVDGRGVPQQGYWWATHVQDTRGFYNQYFETGEDGRFHTAIPEIATSRPTGRSVLFRRTVPDLELQAWLDLADLGLHEGRNELGDVVLRPAPTIVAGRVVDDRGEPITGAELAVWQGDPDGEAWPVGGVNDAKFTSGADGDFVVRGHLRASKLLLRGKYDGTSGALMPFVAGSSGVVYVLPRVGAVEIPLGLTGGLTADRVLFVREHEPTGATRAVASRYVFADGVVTWRGLEPGRYHFGARPLGTSAMLFRTAAVEVHGGETTRLPRQEIGADLRTIVVRVVDAEGRPIERASVVADAARLPGQPLAALKTKLGAVELLTPTVPVDLLVFAPGFRTATARGVTRDTTVRMYPGLVVELLVTLPGGFPGPDQQLLPRVRSHDAADPDPQLWRTHDVWLGGAGSIYHPSRDAPLWDEERPVGRDGRVLLHVPAPGEYVVEWELRGVRERELPRTTRRLFSVREQSEPTRVEVALSAADVRED